MGYSLSMRKIRLAIVLSFITLSTISQARAASEATSQEAIRDNKRIGFYLSGLGDPFPSIVGINVAYNVLDELRLSAGLGEAIFGESVGFGVKYIILPERPVSPVMGLGITRTRIVDVFGGIFGGTPGPDDILVSGNFSAGADWQTDFGFNLGLGASWIFATEEIGIRVLPYINIGWFF
jgi:hypothetical protein